MHEFLAVPAYWNGWLDGIGLESYVRTVIEDAGTRVEALERGEVHMIDWAQPEEQVRLGRAGFAVVEEPSIQIYDVKLNTQMGYTADVHVRRAISYAFDYSALAQIWGGRAVLTEGPLPPNLEWVAEDLTIYRLNLQRALEELARSAWPTGGFNLDYVYVHGLEEERLTGELLRTQLANINIGVNIIPMSWVDAVGTFGDARTAPAVFPLYASTAYSDPDNYLWTGYHSSQAGQWTNPGHYQNPDLDGLLEQARASVDTSERKQLYDQAQRIIVDDAVNIFGLSCPDNHVYSPLVRGLRYCPVMGADEDFYRLHF